MSKWKEVRFDEIGDVFSGGTPSTTNPELWDGDIAFVTPYDLSKNRTPYIKQTQRYITQKGLGQSSANLLPPNNLILSSRAPIGYIALSATEFVTNQGCKSLKFFVNQEPLFHYYNLQMYVDEMKRFGVGTTFSEISKGDLSKLKIRIPKENIDQRKIAHILTTCDTVIEETQSAIAKYKAIKQGLLHDLFTRGLDANGHLRPSYQDAPELYKESELGMIPKEWESCKMGKYILNNLYGPRFDAKDYSENGNVKTIRGTDFTKEGEILYEQAPKALLPIILINAHKLNEGDIVMVTTASCGLTAVFKKPANDVDFIPSAYSVKYRFADNVNPYFVKYFMSTDKAIRQVNKYVRQGTLGNLPGSDVLRFDMIYPDKIEQDKIVNRLFTIDNKIQTEETLLQKYQSIKRGLMGDLLGGKKEFV